MANREPDVNNVASISTILEAQLKSIEKIESYAAQSRLFELASAIESKEIMDDDDKLVVASTELLQHAEDSYYILVEIKDKISKLVDVLSVTKEDKTENAAKTDAQIAALEEIAKNTTPSLGAKTTQNIKEGLNVGGIVAGIVGSLGALAGILAAQVENIKFWGKLLTPESFKKNIFKSIENIQSFFIELFGKIKKVFEPIVDFFTETVSKIKTFFSKIFDDITKLFDGNIFKKIKAFASEFSKPFVELFEFLKDVGGESGIFSKMTGLFDPIKNLFTSIGKYFGDVGKLFTGMKTFFQKIALPITIIMTAFDTITAAIDGFKKGFEEGGLAEGLKKGLFGAIKGFFDSIIFSFADLIKDAISWTANLFGFEEISKKLDSFSFVEMFDSIIDSIDNIMIAFENFFINAGNAIKGMVRGIGIPEFTIPYIDVKVGPFYPFADLESLKSSPTKSYNKTTFNTESQTSTEGNTQPSNVVGTSPQASGASDVSQPSNVVGTSPQASGVDYILKPEPQTGNAIQGRSAENVDVKENLQTSGGSPTVVSAPTNINNSKTVNQQSIKLATRNIDNTVQRYISSRYSIS